MNICCGNCGKKRDVGRYMSQMGAGAACMLPDGWWVVWTANDHMAIGCGEDCAKALAGMIKRQTFPAKGGRV